mgnify:CR=1 FL=1
MNRAVLKNNLSKNHQIDLLDLNIEFHKIKFPKFQEFYKSFIEKGKEEYE